MMAAAGRRYRGAFWLRVTSGYLDAAYCNGTENDYRPTTSVQWAVRNLVTSCARWAAERDLSDQSRLNQR